MRRQRFLSMPFQVGWDVIQQCNLRCRHCYFSAAELSDRAYLPKNAALDFIQHLGSKKVFHLSLAGGEPLLYPHLEAVISEATRLGIVVALSTNALLLTRDRAESLWQTGLRSMQISLDGSCPEVNDRIRGRGVFDKVLVGLRNAVTCGFEVLVATVLVAINKDDVINVFSLAAREGASGVKVQTLIERGLGELNRDQLQLEVHDLMTAVKNL